MRLTFRRSAGALSAAAALAALSGCAQVGNLLLPPHPSSLQRGEARLALSDRADCAAPAPAHVRSAAALAGGVVVAATQAFLAREARRYEASWSATGSTDDLLEDRCIALDGGGSGALELSLASAIERSGPARRSRNATRVEAGVFTAAGARSKVASWPLRTWVRTGRFPWPESTSGRIGSVLGFANPLMLLHFLYGLLDDDAYTVEYAARLRIEAIGDGRRIAATALTLPLGRISIDAVSRDADGDGRPDGVERAGLESGYFPLPKGDPLLANVTVTIVEANDLGDVVGHGAELVGERKGTLLELLGLD